MKSYYYLWLVLCVLSLSIAGTGTAVADGVSTQIDGSKIISGTITGGAPDVYAFEVKQDSSFVVILNPVPASEGGRFLQVDLLAPDGNIVDGQGVGQGYARLVAYNPPAGVWKASVGSVNTGSQPPGNYQLRLIKTAEAKGAPLKFGNKLTSKIEGAAVDVYTVSGTPGVNALLEMNLQDRGAFAHELTVFDPDGMEAGGMGCTDKCQLGVMMEKHGRYTITIWRGDYEAGGGRYSLSLGRVNGPIMAADGMSKPAPDDPPAGGINTVGGKTGGHAVVAPQAAPRAPAAAGQIPQNQVAQTFTHEELSEVYATGAAPFGSQNTMLIKNYAQLYMRGLFLNYHPVYPNDAERAAAAAGNPLVQLYLGDRAYPAIEEAGLLWASAAMAGNADAKARLGATGAENQKYKPAAWYQKILGQASKNDYVDKANDALTAVGAYQKLDKALALYQAAATEGVGFAQYNLGALLAFGLTEPPNYAAAAAWYAKAADQGIIVAQYALGELFEYGRGVKRNDKTAVKFYTAAAESGYPPALYKLGMMTASGRGVAKDNNKAAGFFRQASDEGHMDAQVMLLVLQDKSDAATALLKKRASFGSHQALRSLAKMYRRTAVPAEDYDHILAIYRQGAERKDPEAYAALGDLFAKSAADPSEAYFWYRYTVVQAKGMGLPPTEKEELIRYATAEAEKLKASMLPEQIAVAHWRIKDVLPPEKLTDKQKTAASLFKKGAAYWQSGQYDEAVVFLFYGDKSGIARAQNILGVAFQKGYGVRADIPTAITYYKKAVRGGLVGPASNIGDIYAYGIGIKPDPEEAAIWYALDAARGVPSAMNKLVSLYLQSPQDKSAEIRAVYEKAAARGILSGYDGMGMTSLYGMGTKVDPQEALKWYLKGYGRGSFTGLVQAMAIMVKHEPHDYGLALKMASAALAPVTLNNAAYMIENGLGAAEQEKIPGVTPPTAIELYKKAADMCYGRSMYHIARLLAEGSNNPAVSKTPLKKDPAAAHQWMVRAAQHGSQAALIWLAKQEGYKNDKEPLPEMPTEEVGFPPLSCEELKQ